MRKRTVAMILLALTVITMTPSISQAWWIWVTRISSYGGHEGPLTDCFWWRHPKTKLWHYICE